MQFAIPTSLLTYLLLGSPAVPLMPMISVRLRTDIQITSPFSNFMGFERLNEKNMRKHENVNFSSGQPNISPGPRVFYHISLVYFPHLSSFLITGRTAHTLTEIRETFQATPTELFQFLQIKHWLTTRIMNKDMSIQLSKHICHPTHLCPKLI